MAGHCGRGTSVLLRALLEAETRPGQILIRRAKKHHGIRHLSSCGILSPQCQKLPLPSVNHEQTRTFLNLAVPLLGNKRIDYSESRVLGYSMDQMFDVVANVGDYKIFVPWCNKSKVLSCQKGLIKAELEVGFPPFVERYVSEISIIPGHKIRAVCNDGKLFSHLETVWRFNPGLTGRPDTCTLDFYVSFEFKSLLHSQLATLFFDEVVKQMVSAFEHQASRIHGQQAVPVQGQKARAVR
ncbi:coenzyme Q-binding protein COQ10 homolog B, mitochondrial [Bombina bombina]|uniref:coenzyme Q-binding protein COQ10 homolog B, mitochondrial n=1 Tax=Bombina bombina TaxID=8345 RepID=UPI00235A8C81|nr:coenzyme Q-binding protein COQ10 homolog B, mitochondrial [Bombina bombina]